MIQRSIGPRTNPNHWPGGDPIERLKRHLVAISEWSEKSHTELSSALEHEVAVTFQNAEAYGTVVTGLGQAPEAMFDDVYATVPGHLQSQCDEVRAMSAVQHSEEPPILSFAEASQRAAG